MRRYISVLFRKKMYNPDQMAETKLSRVLGLFDITSFGIAFTIAGIYILGGDIIINHSGPAVVVSFLIAGIATLLSALCYAELGARVPRSGSAYVYIYVTIGEMLAFIMGWDLILEYIIGVASIGSALSQNIDGLIGYRIKNWLKKTMPINIHSLNSYPDFFAMIILLLASSLMIFGIRESARINKAITVFNLSVILLIIILGSTKADLKNWNLNFDLNSTNSTICVGGTKKGDGGFAPFGMSGIISGSAACFYAYIGFDAVATTGEEVKQPKRTVPIAIFLTFIIVSLSYFGISVVLTLMMPYCMIDLYTPLPVAFDYVGLGWAKYIVSIGSLLTILSCLYSGLYPMSRIVYAMANDGLLAKIFSNLNSKFKTPTYAILVTGVSSSILTLFLDLNQLIEMISIGTLMAYSVVSLCVIILRYRPPLNSGQKDETLVKANSLKEIFFVKFHRCCGRTSRNANICTFFSVILTISICLTLRFAKSIREPFIIAILAGLFALLVLSLYGLWKQPENSEIDTFKCPLFPFLPMIGISINVYLLLTLAANTWYRFLVWFLLGLVVYFAYGIRCSNERKNKIEIIDVQKNVSYDNNKKAAVISDNLNYF